MTFWSHGACINCSNHIHTMNKQSCDPNNMRKMCWNYLPVEKGVAMGVCMHPLLEFQKLIDFSIINKWKYFVWVQLFGNMLGDLSPPSSLEWIRYTPMCVGNPWLDYMTWCCYFWLLIIPLCLNIVLVSNKLICFVTKE